MQQYTAIHRKNVRKRTADFIIKILFQEVRKRTADYFVKNTSSGMYEKNLSEDWNTGQITDGELQRQNEPLTILSKILVQGLERWADYRDKTRADYRLDR
jgi:hypothetical protein